MPQLQEVPVHKLRPTQLTVGMIEMKVKKKHLVSLKPAEQREFLRSRPMPAAIGPEKRLYITDHHHLGRYRGEHRAVLRGRQSLG